MTALLMNGPEPFGPALNHHSGRHLPGMSARCRPIMASTGPCSWGRRRQWRAKQRRGLLEGCRRRADVPTRRIPSAGLLGSRRCQRILAVLGTAMSELARMGQRLSQPDTLRCVAREQLAVVQQQRRDERKGGSRLRWPCIKQDHSLCNPSSCPGTKATPAVWQLPMRQSTTLAWGWQVHLLPTRPARVFDVGAREPSAPNHVGAPCRMPGQGD